jgi:hypothetical protein
MPKVVELSTSVIFTKVWKGKKTLRTLLVSARMSIGTSPNFSVLDKVMSKRDGFYKNRENRFC